MIPIHPIPPCLAVVVVALIGVMILQSYTVLHSVVLHQHLFKVLTHHRRPLLLLRTHCSLMRLFISFTGTVRVVSPSATSPRSDLLSSSSGHSYCVTGFLRCTVVSLRKTVIGLCHVVLSLIQVWCCRGISFPLFRCP